MKLDAQNERVSDLLQLWGVPYSWGAGRPSDAAGAWPPDPLPTGINGGHGLDCSGAAQVMLVRLGLLESGAIDRTAASLAHISQPVPPELAQLGDLAFYGSAAAITHVMVCLGGGVVFGARGGGSRTNGDDPKAFVQLEPLRYRADLVSVGRITR